jgi:Raf kinase inhibitor-like YbhB/YbcL family protein
MIRRFRHSANIKAPRFRRFDGCAEPQVAAIRFHRRSNVMSFTLTSTSFAEGRVIPTQHTGEADDASPPLEWINPPENARSFALIVEDPDAPRGTFTHWVAFNMSAESRELSEGVPRVDGLPNGTRQGVNDFGEIGYNGPKPPPGKPHHYLFHVYALDQPLPLSGGASKKQLQSAMKGHVLAQATLTGTFAHGRRENTPTDPFEKKVQQDRASIHTARPRR